MPPTQDDFYNRVIFPLENKLLALPLGALFSGILYDEEGEPIVALRLPDLGIGGLYLNAAEIGRLFFAPDESTVTILTLREQDDGTPAGVNVISSNGFVQEGEEVAVVAYSDINGAGLRLDALYLSRVMLAVDAPERFCTVAFGLQACTAFRLGFAEITLFAGGRGLGEVELDADDLIGYQVWPKFGFDAPLQAADLNRDARFSNCLSVQDVVERDPLWWTAVIFKLVVAQVLHLCRFFEFWFLLLFVSGLRGTFFRIQMHNRDRCPVPRSAAPSFRAAGLGCFVDPGAFAQ
jgi:hypothetical protein